MENRMKRNIYFGAKLKKFMHRIFTENIFYDFLKDFSNVQISVFFLQ